MAIEKAELDKCRIKLYAGYRFREEIMGDWSEPGNLVFADAITQAQREIVKAICGQAVATAQSSKPDPYNPHGLKESQRLHDERHLATLTASLPQNEAARLRNVAALKVELGRPVTQPRFPSEARSDRVTGYRRW